MRNWMFLFGLATVFAALVVAAAEASLYQEAAQATMTLGGGLFTIPLAAVVRA